MASSPSKSNAKSKKKSPSAQPEPEEQAPAVEELQAPEQVPPEEAATESAPVDETARYDELNNRFLRLQADFDNFRKRTVRERSESIARANEDLLAELLPVLDHYEMGLETARNHETEESVVNGFQLVCDQFVSALKKFGVEQVAVLGKPFDPHNHEAMTHLPSEEYPEDTVMTQYRKGYTLNGRLLRAAQVVVSSGPGPQGEEQAEDQQAEDAGQDD